MNPLTLHILKKDLRRLWLLLLAWWAVQALEMAFPALRLNGPLSNHDSGNALHIFLIFMNLASTVVIATRLIEDDSPVNDRAFWRTLPVTGSRMVGAKGLFAALFLVLPALLFSLATKVVYRFPPAEWFDGAAPYAAGLVSLAVIMLAVPSIFRRVTLPYISCAIAAAILLVGVGIFQDTSSPNAIYLWTHGGEIAAYTVLFLVAGSFIVSTLLLRDQPRLSGVLLMAAWLLWSGIFVKMISGWNGSVFANLHTVLGALELLPLLLGGAAAASLMYMRFKRHQGALVLVIGLLASVNIILRGPVHDWAPARELLQLPPGNTIAASGVTGSVPDFASFRPGAQLPMIREPQLRFESTASGNLSIFDTDKAWNFGYSAANIRWPDGTTIKFSDGAYNGGYGNSLLFPIINYLVTGRPSPDATPRQKELVFGGFWRIYPGLFARLQREPAIIEGQALYTTGSFEKIADFPLIDGATLSAGPSHLVLRSTKMGARTIKDEEGSRAWPLLTLNVAILSSQLPGNLYRTDGITDDSPAMLFVLWNPSRQECFDVGESNEGGVVTYDNADFAENGVPFHLANFILETSLYFAPTSSSNYRREPMSPEEGKAWLAGARLLAFHYTPHFYYLPFKTAPFVLQATPPAP